MTISSYRVSKQKSTSQHIGQNPQAKQTILKRTHPPISARPGAEPRRRNNPSLPRVNSTNSHIRRFDHSNNPRRRSQNSSLS
jgi:hypothetical protein